MKSNDQFGSMCLSRTSQLGTNLYSVRPPLLILFCASMACFLCHGLLAGAAEGDAKSAIDALEAAANNIKSFDIYYSYTSSLYIKPIYSDAAVKPAPNPKEISLLPQGVSGFRLLNANETP